MQIDSFHEACEHAGLVFPVERGCFMVKVDDAAALEKNREATEGADIIRQMMKHRVTGY